MSTHTYFNNDELQKIIQNSKFKNIKLCIKYYKDNYSYLKQYNFDASRLLSNLINKRIRFLYINNEKINNLEFIKFLNEFVKIKINYDLMLRLIRKYHSFDTINYFFELMSENILINPPEYFFFDIIKYGPNKKILELFVENEIIFNKLKYYNLHFEENILHRICRMRPQIYLIDKLINKKDLMSNINSSNGNTPLHYLMLHNYINPNLIDKFKSQVNIKNNSGKKPLEILCSKQTGYFGIRYLFFLTNLKSIRLLVRFTFDNETKINSIKNIIRDLNNYVLFPTSGYYVSNISRVYSIIKVFIEEGTIINNDILNQSEMIKPSINSIIKLLIKNGLSITKKSNVNERIKKYYKNFLKTKSRIIYNLGYFNKDIISIIIQY